MNCIENVLFLCITKSIYEEPNMSDEIHSIATDEGEIVIYQPDENIKLEVKIDQETVWLS